MLKKMAAFFTREDSYARALLAGLAARLNLVEADVKTEIAALKAEIAALKADLAKLTGK